MELNPDVCRQARLSRDSRFDGRFFIGVKTTGIYCRPVCPVKLPKEENVNYFATAASATEAGYRPCLRCRPESSPGTPAWCGTSTTVSRGLRLISEGALDEANVDRLSERLGVTPRHLSRLFKHHLGASPKAVAQTRRLQFAKKLLDETSLAMTEIALSAGYGSIRRFNDHFKRVYQKSPSDLRRRQKVPLDKQSYHKGLCLKLTYRPPYDFEAILDFLRVRATPGVEVVNDHVYSRSIFIGGESGLLAVKNIGDENALECLIQMESATHLLHIVERVKQQFDLNADPVEIKQCLCRDSKLKPLVNDRPGTRLPGAWDGFEIAVRALVGQQISVVGATHIMGRIASQFGRLVAIGEKSYRLFPEAGALAGGRPEDFPMPEIRAKAICELSRQVAEGEISFDANINLDDLMARMLRIKGIGHWTAQYVAMRALNQPDAFLHSDLVLKKVVRHLYGLEGEKQILEQSDNWRPWRAYASMYLWRSAALLA